MKAREVYHIYLLMYTNNSFFFYLSSFQSESSHVCCICFKVQWEVLLQNFDVYHCNLLEQFYSQCFLLALKKSMKFIFPKSGTSSEIYLFCTFIYFPFCRFSFAFSPSSSQLQMNEHTGREWPYLLFIRSFITVQALKIFNFLPFHRFVYFPSSSFFPLARATDLHLVSLTWFSLFSYFFILN